MGPTSGTFPDGWCPVTPSTTQPLHNRADHCFLSPGSAGLFQQLSQRPGLSEPPDGPVHPQYALRAAQQRAGGERGEAGACGLCFRLVLRQDPLSVTTSHPKLSGCTGSQLTHLRSAGRCGPGRARSRACDGLASSRRRLPSSRTPAPACSYGAGSRRPLGTSPRLVTG